MREMIGYIRFLGKTLLRGLGLKRRRSVAPGIAIFGQNIFFDSIEPKSRSFYALEYARKFRPKSVIDVGSGGGEHAMAFLSDGAEVVCVDYGTSVYAKNSNLKGFDVLHVDFNAYNANKKFDLVWASHILEHQRNAGKFIEKLIDCCLDEGMIIITVPDFHRVLCGGHLSMWTPGILAYNIVMCGLDISDSRLIRGTNEFSIAFTPKKITLPEISYDKGDVDILSKYFPKGYCESIDQWTSW